MTEETIYSAATGNPSPKQQSWGAVISIIVIVLMIVVGAFYAWGKRIAEQKALTTQAASSSVAQYP